MHQLEKDPATWLTINSPQAAAAEKCFSDWLAANPVKPNQTLTHYLALLKNAGKNLIDNNLFFQLSTQIDRPLNQKLLEVLRAAGSNLSEQEIFSMCLSPEPADVEKHERLLADLRRLAEQQKLNLNPENFEANLKNAEFSAKLRECYCHGYFLRSGYGGVVLWSMKDEYQLLLAPAGPRTSPNPIFAKPSADLSHLSPEPQLWIKLAQHFSHLRDRRKTMQQKAFYHMAQILEEIGKLANRSRADLENLRIEEFDEKFITSPAATKLINQRKAGYLGFWSPNSGTWEWDGQTAQQNYQLLAKKPQPTAELKGSCACPGVARGPVRIVLNPRLQHDFIEGEILVTGMTSPDFVPLMKKAAAVITELGGITCHAAIISRELNKPCVIGALGATQVLKDGEWVEVEAGKGLVKKLS
jgi:phosphohistidine swiveling domain-containing protein